MKKKVFVRSKSEIKLNQTGSGFIKDKRTKRNRSRNQKKKKAIEEFRNEILFNRKL
jgi:hypothetical protein